jgi:hypothetical protein
LPRNQVSGSKVNRSPTPLTGTLGQVVDPTEAVLAPPPPRGGGRRLSLTGTDGLPGATLADLGSTAAGCRACPLWEHASQTVFGAGPPTATVMLVGEQPGDVEDHQGAPSSAPQGASSTRRSRVRASPGNRPT